MKILLDYLLQKEVYCVSYEVAVVLFGLRRGLVHFLVLITTRIFAI